MGLENTEAESMPKKGEKVVDDLKSKRDEMLDLLANERVALGQVNEDLTPGTPNYDESKNAFREKAKLFIQESIQSLEKQTNDLTEVDLYPNYNVVKVGGAEVQKEGLWNVNSTTSLKKGNRDGIEQ